ncbi:MAG: type II secretion system F family protein [Planctomycetaceae bacterium]|nr:type II secretion system F family protein [Planctomycetales bacterium]MCB9927658.1 type II secretion system F family protein [Planctomycetaceae bacterium]
MPHYKYTARDSEGKQFTDKLEADSEQAARQILETRGFEIKELAKLSNESRPHLSTDESQQVTTRLAQLAGASLPLAAGLRAAADDCGNRRVAQVMHEIANQVDGGRSLEDILTSSPHLFPPHVSGLVLAATKTGNLGAALSEFLEHQRSVRSLRRAITRGLSYPLFVLCLAVVVLLVILFGISDPYIRLFAEFDLQLPLSTRLLIWWRDYGVVCAGLLSIGVVVITVVLRLTLPRASWSRVIARVPIFGPLTYWSGIAEWCSLVSVLVKNQIGLAEALQLSAAGIDSAYVGQISKDLARQTADGRSLSELLATNRPFPVSLVPLVRWGERVGLLHEAFGTAKELFDRRVRVRALMLQSILPPILFVIIASSVVMVLGALFAPLTNLVQSLS